jgi:hypothetical protein
MTEDELDLAAAYGARYLASRDKDLLDFAADEAVPSSLSILDSAASLQELAPERRRSAEHAPEGEHGDRNIDPA